MHLKSLTLKGFKSFASATTLRLEPGITCVVGPNGSGKCNVVDAISWVLGEQGAKALRGGKMEDVIFAGTSGRAPLGRAEVTLTIDNSDGALPIDYSEVSITRRMFRDGAGEYEINGTRVPPARHPGAAQRLRHRPRAARRRRAGPARLRAAVAPGGPPRLHRGGRGRPQAPQAQGEGAAEAGRDAGQPHPADGPHRRAAPPAQAAGPAGRDRPAGPGGAVRAARRAAAAGRRRPGHAARRAGPRGGRRGGRAGPPARGRGAARRRPGPSSSGWKTRWPRTRRGWRPRRTPGTGSRRWPSACAAPSGSPRSVRGTSPTPATRGRRGATRTSWRPRPRSSPSRRRSSSRPSWTPGSGSRRCWRSAPSTRRRSPPPNAPTWPPSGRWPTAGPGSRRWPAGRRRCAAVSSANAEEIERLSEALGEADARTAEAHERARGGPRGDRGGRRGATTAWGSGSRRRRRRTRPRGPGCASWSAAERAAEQQRAHWRARVEALSVGLARRDGSGALLGDAAPDGVLGALSGLVTVEPEARTAVAAALGELADAVAVESLEAAVAALRQLRAGGRGPRRRCSWRPADAGRRPSDGRPASGAPPRRRRLGGGPPGWSTRPPRWPRRCAGCCAASWSWTTSTPRARGRAPPGSPPSPRRRRARRRAGVRRLRRRGERAGRAGRGGRGGGRPGRRRGGAGPAATRAGGRAGRGGGAAGRPDRRPGGPHGRRAPGERRRGPAGPAGAGRAVGHGAEAERLRERRDAVEAKRLRRAARAGGRRAAARGRRGRAGRRRAGHRDPRRRRGRAGRRPRQEVEARLALRTAEERARAIAGRAESLRRQASSERQARARAAAARAARERGARIAADRRLGRGDGLRARSPSRWLPPPSSATPPRPPAPSGSAPLAEVRTTTSRLTALLEKLVDAVHRDEVLRAQSRAAPGAAHRQGARRPRPGRRRPRRRVRAARARAGVGGGDGRVRGGQRARRGRRGAAADALRPRHPAAPGRRARRRTSGCWAG